jgi:dGTPase
MDVADQIAYINHDVDDGLRAGMISVKKISDFKLWKNAQELVIEKYGKKITKKNAETRRRFISRVVSLMIKSMVHDLIKTTTRNLRRYKINSLDRVRASGRNLVAFSPAMTRQIAEIRPFLFKEFYNNPKVASKISRGKKIIKKLFLYYINKPNKLPTEYYAQIKGGERPEVVVKDYVSGMTDHFAEEIFKSL